MVAQGARKRRCASKRPEKRAPAVGRPALRHIALTSKLGELGSMIR
jgi:hypothetical protein